MPGFKVLSILHLSIYIISIKKKLKSKLNVILIYFYDDYIKRFKRNKRKYKNK